jgi:hypothetical protein
MSAARNRRARAPAAPYLALDERPVTGTWRPR